MMCGIGGQSGPGIPCLKVGLTGGIGTGKSTVAEFFQVLGVPVFYSDKVARTLLETDSGLRQEMTDFFGPEVYLAPGKLNASWLGQKIFRHKADLLWVNEQVHPLVQKAFQNWISDLFIPIGIEESAILFESGVFAQMDANILVVAPMEMVFQRVFDRSGMNRDELEARMANQWPESEKRKRATFVINNDGKQAIIPQVLEIYKHLQTFSHV